MVRGNNRGVRAGDVEKKATKKQRSELYGRSGSNVPQEKTECSKTGGGSARGSGKGPRKGFQGYGGGRGGPPGSHDGGGLHWAEPPEILPDVEVVGRPFGGAGPPDSRCGQSSMTPSGSGGRGEARHKHRPRRRCVGANGMRFCGSYQGKCGGNVTRVISRPPHPVARVRLPLSCGTTVGNGWEGGGWGKGDKTLDPARSLAAVGRLTPPRSYFERFYLQPQR